MLQLILTALLTLHLGAQPPLCHVPPSLWTRARRAVSSVLMQVDLFDEHTCARATFQGHLLGVTATITVDLKTRRADILLRGVPVGGRVEGYGWLTNSEFEHGGVQLDDELETALARRFVAIEAAALDRERNVVTVNVSVPIFGMQYIVLTRI